jgi:stage III sporulation protein AG
VKNRKTPEIKGVCVFYSGEDTPTARERLYSAVKGSLGVELHKIEVVLVK